MSAFGRIESGRGRIAFDVLKNYDVATWHRGPSDFWTGVMVGLSEIEEIRTQTEEDALKAHRRMVKKYADKAPPKRLPGYYSSLYED